MFNSVLIGPFGLIGSTSVYLVLFDPIQSTWVLFGPLCSIWSIRSYLVHIGLFGLIRSYLVYFGSIWTIMFNSVLFYLIWSILSTLVLFNHIQSTLGLFCPFGPNYSFLFHYGPELTEVDRMDRIELRWTEVDWIRPQLTKMDWSRLIQIKLMKWTECQFVISVAKIVFWYKFKSLLEPKIEF